MERAVREQRDWDVVTQWAPAVGVAAVTQAGLGLEEPWAGSDAFLTLTSLMLALPLLVRRRWPLVAAGLVAVAAPVQEALGGSLSFGTFVAVLVTAYAVGRHAQPRAAVLGTAVILAGVVLGNLESLPEDATELVIPVFYVVGSVSIGAVVRRLHDQADTLTELNRALARERDATVRLAVAGERMRLSRDLHDSVAHTLTVAVVQAERCEQAIGDDPESATAAAVAIQEAGRRGLAELRSVLRVLRDPDAPVREPGLDDLGALATLVSESGLDVTVVTDGDLARVPDATGVQLFRIVQEALTNVLKHSAAGTATVVVTVDAGAVEVTVTDPGPPLTGAQPASGHGIAVMGERLGGLDGHVTTGRDGTGFRVSVSVPLAVGVTA